MKTTILTNRRGLILLLALVLIGGTGGAWAQKGKKPVPPAVEKGTNPENPEPLTVKKAGAPQSVAAKLIPSVVIIAMLDANNKPAGLGSGFVVEPGILATNYHVIKGASKGVVKLVSDPTTPENLIAIEGVVGVDLEHDLALLKVSDLKAKTLDIDVTDVSIGDTVYAVGNPEGLQGTFSQGLVSGIRDITPESRLIQITAAISPGSSGGPVADEFGKVVGVATSQLVAGQNLNFAVPSSYLQRLMTTSLKGVQTTVRPLSNPLGARSDTTPMKVKGAEIPQQEKPVVASTFAVLKGLQGVSIVVERMTDDGNKIGLRKDRIQSATELSLRRNGVPVLTEEERREKPGRPYLYVNVNVLDSAFTINIELSEDVHLDRDPNIFVLGTTTWSKGTTGIAGGDAAYIIKNVEDLVDKFCLDYLKANPK